MVAVVHRDVVTAGRSAEGDGREPGEALWWAALLLCLGGLPRSGTWLV